MHASVYVWMYRAWEPPRALTRTQRFVPVERNKGDTQRSDGVVFSGEVESSEGRRKLTEVAQRSGRREKRTAIGLDPDRVQPDFSITLPVRWDPDRVPVLRVGVPTILCGPFCFP